MVYEKGNIKTEESLTIPFLETKPKSKRNEMNLYAYDLSYFASFSDNPEMDLRSSSDSLIRSLSDSSDYGDADDGNKRASVAIRRSPPKHRHDGTSPLPLGMDWSTPPRKWVFPLFSFFHLIPCEFWC